MYSELWPLCVQHGTETPWLQERGKILKISFKIFITVSVALAKYLLLQLLALAPWASLHLLKNFCIGFYRPTTLKVQAGTVNGSFYLDFLLSMKTMYVYLLYNDFNNMMIHTCIDMYKTVTVCKKYLYDKEKI
jgi:hypothetical protein